MDGIGNLLGLELEVREYDGDPVQWVIGRNLHRRHLTALQRASCVSAALEWASQGKRPVMHTDRGDSGQYSPTPVKLTGVGEPVSTSFQAGVVRTGLQLGQLHEKASLTGGNEALVVDQSADQDDQDWRTVGAPCRKAGVSAC